MSEEELKKRLKIAGRFALEARGQAREELLKALRTETSIRRKAGESRVPRGRTPRGLTPRER